MLTGLSGLSGLSGVLRGGSVAPPAISVAVLNGLVVTLNSLAGPIASLSSTNGSQTGPLEWTFTQQGVYEITATNAAGSSTVTAIASGFWATGRIAYCYTDTGGTIPAIAGDAVAVEKSPNTGLPSLTQTDPTKRPLAQTDGLQLDAVDDFQQFTAVALAGDFTAYFVGTLVASTNYIPFGSSAGAAFIRFQDGTLYVLDDAGSGPIMSKNVSGLQAFRIRRASGVAYVKSTGSAESAGTAMPGTVTLETTGHRLLSGQQNGDAAQRYLTRLLFNRDLSAGEQALIEAHLLSVDGVAP